MRKTVTYPKLVEPLKPTASTPTVTQAQASTVIKRVADELVAQARMVEDDCKEHNALDEDTKLECFVRRALARELHLRASLMLQVCKGGSCAWKGTL